jgi:hypothetical protein
MSSVTEAVVDNNGSLFQSAYVFMRFLRDA